MIRVLIVSEMGLVCNMMASLLEDEPDIKVIGTATTIDAALAQVSDADVALVSTHLPDNGALEFTQRVVEGDPSVKVVVVGLRESEQQILQYVEAGADGYVLRDHSTGELLENIRAVKDDEALVSPDIAYALISRVTELSQVFSDVEANVDESAELTPREREVLELIGEDLTNQEIADRLYIEVGTVKNHVHSILQKLGVKSREDAAAYLALLDDDSAQT